ncbi:unnamed protein product [Mytilus coruscus]|uniref:Mab-21-like HhH/H2TH-like domain-containing protein n=1 Tax=Mytilus coruscus TaxID=42192 RepID=A0A6J8BTX7_MYTCO|nr:unnamed protein product [Mytilus coruscus]
MSTDKSLSLHFYKYLCQKIGSEEDVRVRRLTWIVNDIGSSRTHKQISSGSKGEGLDIKGSDFDIMFIDPEFKVYESDIDVVLPTKGLPLVMDTENTHPCFTQLHFPLHFLNDYILLPEIEQMLEQDYLVNKLSNVQYKHDKHDKSYSFINFFPEPIQFTTIHGPCISDQTGDFDLAFCLKCDKWITLAQSWISRPHTTWPAPELITKITSCGVLFDSKFQQRSNNKHQYYEYNHNLGKLLIVVSPKTISGWLMLASFFYVHKQYYTSIIIINHALKKHQDEEFFQHIFSTSLFQNKDFVRTLLKREKHPMLLKNLTLNYISLDSNSSFIPPEVKLNEKREIIPTLPFAHFLHFLCYYQLHATASCTQSLQKLFDIMHDIVYTKNNVDVDLFHVLIHSISYLGIGFQMMGDTIIAREMLEIAAKYDTTKVTNAAARLSCLS